MIYTKFIVIFTLFCKGFSSAIPIWELLTYQEKVGNLTFVFMDLVSKYCKKSTIPDCERVLTLYGVSNLLKEDEYTLDLLDPHHWNSRSSLWRVAMNGAFEYPPERNLGYGYPYGRRTEVEEDLNTISNSADVDYGFPNYYDYDVEEGEPHPYAVKVLPPPGFKHGSPATEKKSSMNFLTNKSPSMKTPTNADRQHPSKTQAKDDSSYIVLLPNGSPPAESVSSRSQNDRFRDFRQISTLKESRNGKIYTESSHKPNKPILYTILRK
ncbi:UNVERIFIED_CONTAM: hypothetical protein RMT77_019270 [Armadillidium vulgare]